MAGEQHVADLDPFDLLDAESERVARFLETASDETWERDTRCAGWRVRELLSHLDGVELYHTACLDDTVKQFLEGVTDLDSFNDEIVRERAELPREAVLESWRRANADVRRRLRERGRDGTMSSSVGPYPVGLMAFHIASEYATHGDDMGVEVDASEHAERDAWRAKVSRFALEEAEKRVEVEEKDGSYLVRAGGKEATLSEREFVEAVTARLPEDRPLDDELRDALRALA